MLELIRMLEPDVLLWQIVGAILAMLLVDVSQGFTKITATT